MAAKDPKTCLDDDDINKCPKTVIIEATNANIHSDRSYIKYLKDNGIETGPFVAWSLRLSEIIGTRYIGALIAGSLIVSGLIGYGWGCSGLSSAGCQRSVFQESSITRSDRSSNRSWPKDIAGLNSPSSVDGAPSETINSGNSEKKLIDRVQIEGDAFSLPSFQAAVIAFAFILAFSRWMIENRQSAMSELFERKKEVNLLLLKDEKGVFQPLISEAVRPQPPRRIPERTRLHDDTVKGLLRRAATALPVEKGGASKSARGVVTRIKDILREPPSDELPENAVFLRQMFVYIELDNFELAFNRYVSGLLDPEQMYRACEIIESRCLNPTFRYMAAAQGLKYYTDNFHRALIPILVRAEYLDRGDLHS